MKKPSKTFESKILHFSFDNIFTQWTCTAEEAAVIFFHFQSVFYFLLGGLLDCLMLGEDLN